MRISKLRSSLRVGLAVLVLAGAAAGPAAAKEKMSRAGFAADMRKLWEDHITWTRLFIVDALGNLPSKAATTDRLLQNQTDIGNAIKPFYGDAAGTKLTGLLRDHILIAADLVGAAAAGDKAKQDAANQRWLANADEIAALLTAADRHHWPAATTKQMMHEHLELTTKEVVAHLSKDYKGSVAAYDAVHAQILHMADALSSGIEATFPNKFRE
jgi:hypothetical protein